MSVCRTHGQARSNSGKSVCTVPIRGLVTFLNASKPMACGRGGGGPGHPPKLCMTPINVRFGISRLTDFVSRLQLVELPGLHPLKRVRRETAYRNTESKQNT